MICLILGKMGEGMSYDANLESLKGFYVRTKELQNYRIIKKLQFEIDSRYKDLKNLEQDRDFLIFLQQELDTLKTNICPHWRHIEHHENTNSLTLIEPKGI